MDMIPPFARKVNYYETDKMGIVHHSNYIRWFEETRIYYLEAAGYPYSRMEDEGIMIPVISAECSYKNAVTFGETVYITAQVQKFNGFRMEILYTVNGCDGSLKAEGMTSHCFVNKDMKLVRTNKDHPGIYKVFTELCEMNGQ